MATRATYLQITFTDGQQWRVPALVIAEHRAKYYAEQDPDTTFEREVQFTLENQYELVDWARNNMVVSDVEKHATKVADRVPIEFEDGWNDGESEFTTVRV